MNKEFYKMQKLAGLITESQYIKLLEDQTTIDRILDKISAQGIESLTPEEKNYLDKHSKGEKDIPEPSKGPTEIYVSEQDSERYKIENFPALSNAESIDFDCDDTDDVSTCENYPEMKEMLSNKKFKYILDKLKNDAFPDDTYFHGITFMGDFSYPSDIVYAQVSGDGYLYIIDSENFGEEDMEYFGLKTWRKI